MKLVTVASDWGGYFDFLKASCARHGAPLEVLGWGQPWQGYTWKLTLMQRFLAAQAPDAIVCFIDAYDVVLLRSWKAFEAAFLEHERQHPEIGIIAGCENIASPFQAWFARLMFGHCKQNMLNSGTYIGRADALRRMVDESLRTQVKTKNNDDQVILTQYCQQHPQKVHMDCDGSWFLTRSMALRSILSDPDVHVDPETRMVTYKHTRRPFLVHGNGNTLLEPLLEQLGYPRPSPSEQRRINAYHRRSLLKKLAHYTAHLAKWILVMAAILVVAIVVLTLLFLR